MSIHPSLRVGSGQNRHRSVLKRHERLKTLKEKHLWDEEKSVLGIPKVKMQKLRVKKEKPAATEGAAPAGGAPAAPAAKAAAPAPSKAAAPAGKADKK